MPEVWQVAITIAGLGAVGAFVFWSLYREWLRLPIFPKLTKQQAFRLMQIFLVLTFLALIAVLVTYAYVHSKQAQVALLKEQINETRGRLLSELDKERRRSSQLAIQVGIVSGEMATTKSPEIRELAEKLKNLIAQFEAEVGFEPAEADDFEIRLSKAIVANVEGRYEDALGLLPEDEALALIDQVVEVAQVRGHAFHGLKKWDESLESYQRIRALRPENLEARASVAHCLSLLGRSDDALEEHDDLVGEYTKLVEQEEREDLREELARMHHNRGIILRSQNKLKEADQDLAKAENIYNALVTGEGRDDLASQLAAS